MIMQVRTARPSISLGGKDYSTTLAPYLISMTYTDNCDGKKADDLSLELADRDGKFISTWMPKKGAYLDAAIVAERWFMPYAGGISLDCGRFWIDSVEFELPDAKVSVKGTSIPTNVRIKASDETRGWDNTSLKDIANQIAGENQMSVDWQADSNPRYKRIEQTGESGLCFLKKRANDAKLAIKVHRNKIVIFSEQKLEEAAPKFTLLFGNTAAMGLGGASYRMKGGHFTTKVADTTKKATVKHVDVDSGEVKQGEFSSGDEGLMEETEDKVNENTENEDGDQGESAGGGGNRLLIGREGEGLVGDWNNEQASAGASTKAKAHVRDKNKEKDTATVVLSIGNPLVAAGMTFDLKGCGQFDGKYFIESAHHSVGPEFNTELHIRKCLTGY